MASLSCTVLMVTLSSLAYGYITNAVDHFDQEDDADIRLLGEKERQRDIREKALEKLQEVFGLPELGERRHRQVPPQFMTELYNNIADQSGATRRRNPYNAKVVRSFIERDNSLAHYFYFNISGLDALESVLEAQLHLYRMRTPPHELHPSVFTSPSLIIRVYQVLDDHQLSVPDVQRLLSSHMVGAHAHGWEVFNVKEAVMDWVTGRRPNRGLLVTSSNLFEQSVDVRFARRNEHHNSKQPILVLFDDEAAPITEPRSENPDYYKYQNDPANELDDSPARRRRSLAGDAPSLNVSTLGNSSGDGECSRAELFVDFEQIGWTSWIIAPKGYSAYYCRGHCNFPLGQSQRPTNHATVQSIVHELNLAPDVGKPCCVPTSLLNVPLLFQDDNDNVVLRIYEDMVADSCGCQ
ncbi:bone morphogenetic protein 2-like [Periplaneta americana]|uniref:bone morphogenetic protein 2-like n=1 Tax=Periplaneta americana TaxID=6978 RepID=UPI0037E7231A